MPDTYSGTREDLLDVFPGMTLPKNAHEHQAECGGYYWHSHARGAVEHDHKHKLTDSCSPGQHDR